MRGADDEDVPDRYVIQSVEASPRGDYWVIAANTADYVLHGMFDRMLIGVSAYLVDVESGEIHVVGSAQRWQEWLQDRDDLKRANGLEYILKPSFVIDEKVALIRVLRSLGISYRDAIVLLSLERSRWLTGRFRVLEWARDMLAQRGVRTEIVLEEQVGSAISIDESVWRWEQLLERLKDCVGRSRSEMGQ